MSAPSRSSPGIREAAPVRLLHLGLGNFFRAHQVWFTHHAPDGGEWGIAAFTGRSRELADQLTAQDGLYTLVTRAAGGDHFEVIDRLTAAVSAADHPAWLAYLAAPDVAAVTITVTEVGYMQAPDGGLDRGHPAVDADAGALRGDLGAPVSTAPARLVAGLAARRAADAGPITLVPCDNVPDNGAVTAAVVGDLAEMIDPGLAAWIETNVAYVTTMVDRITPATTGDDRRTVAGETGWADAAPVVTEPFKEWVLEGGFAHGRPAWDGAGAIITDDIAPFERRKLWLLNGAHSLLAYAAPPRGHETVSAAVADETCRAWLDTWWDEACAHLDMPADELAAYRSDLLERFDNPRMRHHLDQIAADGSQKLAVRVLPVLERERGAGRMPEGAVRALAAWIMHLRDPAATVSDARAGEVVPLAAGPLRDAVRHVLAALDPAVAEDDDVVAAVVEHAGSLHGR